MDKGQNGRGGKKGGGRKNGRGGKNGSGRKGQSHKSNHESHNLQCNLGQFVGAVLQGMDMIACPCPAPLVGHWGLVSGVTTN